MHGGRLRLRIGNSRKIHQVSLKSSLVPSQHTGNYDVYYWSTSITINVGIIPHIGNEQYIIIIDKNPSKFTILNQHTQKSKKCPPLTKNQKRNAIFTNVEDDKVP